MLLSKFRIDYSDLVIITDADETPKCKTKKWFDGLIRPLLQSTTNGMLFIESYNAVACNLIQFQKGHA